MSNVFALVLGCSEPIQPPELVVPDPVPLGLVVRGPTPGAFVGDVATVFGRVTDPKAIVYVEGYRVNVGKDGSFRVEVPVDTVARVLDIEAVRPDDHLRERIAVFSGSDPLMTWPGGIGLRVTPLAYVHLGEVLEAQLRATVDPTALLEGVAPSLTLGGFSFVPTGVIAPALDFALAPTADGVTAAVSSGRIEVGYDVTGPVIGTIPVVLGIDLVVLEILASLEVDPQGAMVFSVTDTTVVFGDPVFEVAGIDPDVLEQWAGGVTGALGGVFEGVLDVALGLLGTVTLPLGPLQTDALGFPLSLSVADLHTDTAGTAVTLEMNAGVPPAGQVHVPTLVEATPRADVAASVHDGLVQGLLDTTLLARLTLDLELPGFLGEIVALPLAALPGGGALPADRTGMCLSLDAAGADRVARFRGGLAPLLSVAIPEVRLLVSVSSPGITCAPWLDASLFVQADFVVEGTSLVPEIAVVDGAVLAYAAGDPSDEAVIVAGLGGLVDAAMGLLGGSSLAIDLGTLVPAVGGITLAPRVLDATVPTDGAGNPLEGTVVVTMSLFD